MSESEIIKAKGKRESDRGYILAKYTKKTIQSVLFNADTFDMQGCRDWIKEHGLKLSHRGKEGMLEKEYFHFRQKDPNDIKYDYMTVSAYSNWDKVKYIIALGK